MRGKESFAGDYLTPNAFVLKLSYGAGVGEEVAMFTSIQKFRWWVELYREKELGPKQIFLTVRYTSGRNKLHRFPTMKELKYWVRKQGE